jgi:hypothetical protein
MAEQTHTRRARASSEGGRFGLVADYLDDDDPPAPQAVPVSRQVELATAVAAGTGDRVRPPPELSGVQIPVSARHGALSDSAMVTENTTPLGADLLPASSISVSDSAMAGRPDDPPIRHPRLDMLPPEVPGEPPRAVLDNMRQYYALTLQVGPAQQRLPSPMSRSGLYCCRLTTFSAGAQLYSEPPPSQGI